MQLIIYISMKISNISLVIQHILSCKGEERFFQLILLYFSAILFLLAPGFSEIYECLFLDPNISNKTNAMRVSFDN